MLENRLTEKELEELSKFRLTAEKSEGELTFCAADLIKSTTLQPMLKMLKSRIEAPNILVTSSILMKRYAFLPVIYLYALTKWDKKLNFSLDDVHFIQTRIQEKLLFLPYSKPYQMKKSLKILSSLLCWDKILEQLRM